MAKLYLNPAVRIPYAASVSGRDLNPDAEDALVETSEAYTPDFYTQLWGTSTSTGQLVPLYTTTPSQLAAMLDAKPLYMLAPQLTSDALVNVGSLSGITNAELKNGAALAGSLMSGTVAAALDGVNDHIDTVLSGKTNMIFNPGAEFGIQKTSTVVVNATKEDLSSSSVWSLDGTKSFHFKATATAEAGQAYVEFLGGGTSNRHAVAPGETIMFTGAGVKIISKGAKWNPQLYLSWYRANGTLITSAFTSNGPISTGEQSLPLLVATVPAEAAFCVPNFGYRGGFTLSKGETFEVYIDGLVMEQRDPFTASFEAPKEWVLSANYAAQPNTAPGVIPLADTGQKFEVVNAPSTAEDIKARVLEGHVTNISKVGQTASYIHTPLRGIKRILCEWDWNHFALAEVGHTGGAGVMGWCSDFPTPYEEGKSPAPEVICHFTLSNFGTGLWAYKIRWQNRTASTVFDTEGTEKVEIKPGEIGWITVANGSMTAMTGVGELVQIVFIGETEVLLRLPDGTERLLKHNKIKELRERGEANGGIKWGYEIFTLDGSNEARQAFKRFQASTEAITPDTASFPTVAQRASGMADFIGTPGESQTDYGLLSRLPRTYVVAMQRTNTETTDTIFGGSGGAVRVQATAGTSNVTATFDGGAHSVTWEAALPGTSFALVALTVSGTSATLYVNGVSKGTKSITQATPVKRMLVGAQGASGDPLLGNALPMAVYGRALTAEEVATLYSP